MNSSISRRLDRVSNIPKRIGKTIDISQIQDELSEFVEQERDLITVTFNNTVDQNIAIVQANAQLDDLDNFINGLLEEFGI